MATHRIVQGLTYTVKLLVPELADISHKYQEKLKGLVEQQVPLEHVHLGLKYLGYDNDFNQEYILGLVPLLQEIAKKHLPLPITIKGLATFNDRPEWPSGPPIIFLNVLPNKQLQDLHNEICVALNNKTDTFELTQGDHYTPHITIACGSKEKEQEIKKIIEQTKNDQEVKIMAKRMGLRLPSEKSRCIFNVL